MYIRIINLLCAVFEVWLCYHFIGNLGLENRGTCKKKNVIKGLNIMVCGALIAVNRTIIFFSYPILIAGICVTGVCIAYFNNHKKLLSLSMTGLYYVMVSLVDVFLLAVCTLVFDGNEAIRIYYASSGYGLCIYIITRGLLFLGIELLKNKCRLFTNVFMQHQKFVVLFSIVLAYTLRRFQYILVSLLNDNILGDGMEIGWVLFMVLVLTGILIFIFYKSQLLQNENEILELNEKILQHNYHELMEALEANRRMVHDFKHHLMVLKDYEIGKQYEELHQYLIKLSNDVCEKDMCVYTGNRILDFILNQKRAEAEIKSIHMDIQTNALLKLPLNHGDACVLFGNLMDNAIEACDRMKEGEKWIVIRIKKQQQLLFVEITNSITASMKKTRNIFRTEKKDKEMHGYGLKSIERIVNAYGGVLSLRREDNRFKVNITFFEIKE